MKKALQQIRRWETDGTLSKDSPLFSGMVNFQEDSFATTEADRLWEMFSLDHYLRPSRATYEKDQAMIRAIFAKIQTKGNLRGFLNEVALCGMDLLQETELSEKKDAVQLMTLHASKGLEFTCVFIIGVNDGLIPLRGNSFDQEEEERRLLFVGMTRAREQLELSYYTNPDGYGVLPGPGRYLKMFPKDQIEGLEESGYAEGSAAEHLQSMKREILRARETQAVTCNT